MEDIKEAILLLIGAKCDTCIHFEKKMHRPYVKQHSFDGCIRGSDSEFTKNRHYAKVELPKERICEFYAEKENG